MTVELAGQLARCFLFAFRLSYSGKACHRVYASQAQEAFLEGHMAAFGAVGVPARLVPDNLKTGVDRPDLYDPKINRSYAELAGHYGCLVDPARAYRPADKGWSSHCTSYNSSGGVWAGCRVLGGRPAGLNGATAGMR